MAGSYKREGMRRCARVPATAGGVVKIRRALLKGAAVACSREVVRDKTLLCKAKVRHSRLKEHPQRPCLV